MEPELVARLEARGVPGPEFWEDDLEMVLEPVLRRLDERGGLGAWVAKRTGRQLRILAPYLDIDADRSTRRLKPDVQKRAERLLGFLLAAASAKNKSKVAIVGLAKELLPEEDLATCRKEKPPRPATGDGVADDQGADEEIEEEYDTLALVFALFAAEPRNLQRLFHLDKVQKTGFARMKLATSVRKPAHPFADVLEPARLTEILRAFDDGKDDGRRCELKEVVATDGRYFVFIRRPHQRDYIVSADGGSVMHGYHPEWIILDFEEGARRVKISSRSRKVPGQIADRIASAHFEKPCAYDDESTVTYAAQIRRFVDEIAGQRDQKLALVEAAVRNSPLQGAPKLRVSDEHSKPIGPALDDFARAFGEPLLRVANIDGVKVFYRRKRISVIFERLDEDDGDGEDDDATYDVRYTDHRLNGFERTPFEDHMRQTHGIEVFSTEKRGRQGR